MVRSGMPIAEKEMNALRLLLKEELQTEVRLLRAEMNKRFDEIAMQNGRSLPA